ncbi:MAG: hypothetical protein COV76_00185 [Candidatus Omnitrophica bacterium CG11_big_fil_rev_8_21_14_0_20_64_10]|nr:MAG: hypothetical protein COV76_00185 [Candidatus Omnitrophica bacterium CG11_big_fil_rev_8_21_14_0_20_64_10]
MFRFLAVFLSVGLLLPPEAAALRPANAGMEESPVRSGLEGALTAGLESPAVSTGKRPSASQSGSGSFVQSGDWLIRIDGPAVSASADTVWVFAVTEVGDTQVITQRVDPRTLRVDAAHASHSIPPGEIGTVYRRLSESDRNLWAWIAFIRRRAEAMVATVSEGRSLYQFMIRSDRTVQLYRVVDTPPIKRTPPSASPPAADPGETTELSSGPVEKDTEFRLDPGTGSIELQQSQVQFRNLDGSHAPIQFLGEAQDGQNPKTIFEVLQATGIWEQLEHAQKLLLQKRERPEEMLASLQRGLQLLDRSVYKAFQLSGRRGGTPEETGIPFSVKPPGSYPIDRMEVTTGRFRPFPPLTPTPPTRPEEEQGKDTFSSMLELQNHLTLLEDGIHAAIRNVELTGQRRTNLRRRARRGGRSAAIAAGAVLGLAVAWGVWALLIGNGGNQPRTNHRVGSVESGAQAGEAAPSAGLEGMQIASGWWALSKETGRPHQILSVAENAALTARPILWPGEERGKTSLADRTIPVSERSRYRFIPAWAGALAYGSAQIQQLLQEKNALWGRLTEETAVPSALSLIQGSLLQPQPRLRQSERASKTILEQLDHFLDHHRREQDLPAGDLEAGRTALEGFQEHADQWLEWGRIEAAAAREGFREGLLSRSAALASALSFAALLLATGSLIIALQPPDSNGQGTIAQAPAMEPEAVPAKPEPKVVPPKAEPALEPFLMELSPDGKELILRLGSKMQRELAGKWLVGFAYLSARSTTTRTDFLSQGDGPVRIPEEPGPLNFDLNNLSVWGQNNTIGWRDVSQRIFLVYNSEAEAQKAWETANTDAARDGISPGVFTREIFPDTHSVWNLTHDGMLTRLDNGSQAGLEVLEEPTLNPLSRLTTGLPNPGWVVIGPSVFETAGEPLHRLTGLEAHLLEDRGIETIVHLIQQAGGEVRSVRYYGSPLEGNQFRRIAAAAGLEVSIHPATGRLLIGIVQDLLELLGVPAPAAAAGLEAILEAIETSTAA